MRFILLGDGRVSELLSSDQERKESVIITLQLQFGIRFCLRSGSAFL